MLAADYEWKIDYDWLYFLRELCKNDIILTAEKFAKFSSLWKILDFVTSWSEFFSITFKVGIIFKVGLTVKLIWEKINQTNSAWP